MITVVGRGHSGTRAMSHTLSESGVYMGAQLNKSGDLIPAEDMYEACRIMARHVRFLGNLRWDFSRLHDMKIDPAFEQLVSSYLDSVLGSPAPVKGWKLPETMLVFPWIVRLFPEVYYIYWIRDPRDCILGRHLTDDLADFGVPYEHTDDLLLRRAVSWKYQHQIYRATPRPAHLIEVRFEDFVLDQERTLARLESFLGMSSTRIEVRPESVGRWKDAESVTNFQFWQDEMAQYFYTG